MSDLSKYKIFRSTLDDYAPLLKGATIPPNSLVVRYDSRAPEKIEFGVPEVLIARTEPAIEHMHKILSAADFADEEHVRFSFVFQIEDRSVDVPSASWETKKSYKTVCLVPDLYYTRNHGYEDFLPHEVPDWSSRQSRVFWRGTTTGELYFTRESLLDLPRYRLCKAAKMLGDVADVRFYNVVQTRDNERDAVVEHLTQNDMLGDWAEIDQFARYKYTIQIGGNATSWGLAQKLRLGCCVLFVEGDWVNWQERELVPWVHYIPVSADVSDLADRVNWCINNDFAASTIASQARNFVLRGGYRNQLKVAAEVLVKAFSHAV
jgi:hypothetical protein